MIINGEEMLSAMEKAVAERGDGWRYPDTEQCQYLYDPEIHKYDEDGVSKLGEVFGDEEQPACLVGLALYYIDPQIPHQIYDNGWNDTSVEGIWENRTVPLDEVAVKVAQAGQSCQDRGGTWGEALIAAKEIYAEFSDAD